VYALNLGLFTFLRSIHKYKVLKGVQNMKLRENIYGENHLKTCERTDVTKLTVGFSFAIALSGPMDSIYLTEWNYIIISYLTLRPKMRFVFCCWPGIKWTVQSNAHMFKNVKVNFFQKKFLIFKECTYIICLNDLDLFLTNLKRIKIL
jgi:hypothetical protein